MCVPGRKRWCCDTRNILSHVRRRVACTLMLLYLIVTDLYLWHRTQQYLARCRSPVVSSTPFFLIYFWTSAALRPEFCFVHSAGENRGFLPANIRYYPFVRCYYVLLEHQTDTQAILSAEVSKSFTPKYNFAVLQNEKGTKTSWRIFLHSFLLLVFLLVERNEWGFNWFGHFLGVFLNTFLFIFTRTKFQVAVYVSLGP